MLPVSSRFLAAVRSSHQIIAAVTLCDPPGQSGVTPTGRVLAIVDGSVTLDGSADVRGTVDLTVAEPWPATETATDLTPYGAEVFITRGVVFGNGQVERAPLGYFRLTTVEQPDAPAGPLRLTGSDRMAALMEARLLAPVQYAAATLKGVVVADLVQEVLPGQTIEWDDASDVEQLGRTVVAEEDRHAFLRDLVTALGKVWFFDYRGVLVIKDPSAAESPVWDVDAGAGGVLVSASRSLSRDEVKNAVVATGEAVDDVPPSYAVAYDTDPLSPTYWDGDFGKIPAFYSSPLLTSDAKALNAAETILRRSLGLPYSVDFTAVANPALEPLDPVRVTYPPVLGRSPVVRVETHVIDQLRIGLSGPAMSAGTRLQTTGGVG